MEESNDVHSVCDHSSTDTRSQQAVDVEHDLVFQIEEPHEDYCSRCQQLGPAEYGVKMHRSLPSQTWWVKAFEVDTPDDTSYLVMCSDCLYDAHVYEGSEVERVTVQMSDGSPYDPSGHFFIRNTPQGEASSNGS